MKSILSISILVLISLLTSCGSEVNELRDMSDIIPTADGDYSSDTSGVKPITDSLVFLQEQFEGLGISFDSITKVSTRVIADRFGHADEIKYSLIGDGQALNIYRWNYKDSARVTNAMFNWIDCFGERCKSIMVGESKNLQSNAFHLYANDECMIFLESDHAIKTRSVEKYLESVDPKREWNYVLEQSRSGKVRWYQFEDKKKTPIKLEK